MVGGGPFRLPSASGPTTPRWRCAWPNRSSTPATSTQPTSSAGTCSGGATATGRRPARASTSVAPRPARCRGSSGPARRPTPDVDEESAANGSLMRLAAVPIRWHTDVTVAAERSGESSRTTHPASRPVDTCRVMGAMIAALIQGTPADEVLRSGVLDVGRPPPSRRSTSPAARGAASSRPRSAAPATASTRSKPRSGRSVARPTSVTPCCAPPTSATTPTPPRPSPASSPEPAGAGRGSRRRGATGSSPATASPRSPAGCSISPPAPRRTTSGHTTRSIHGWWVRAGRAARRRVPRRHDAGRRPRRGSTCSSTTACARSSTSPTPSTGSNPTPSPSTIRDAARARPPTPSHFPIPDMGVFGRGYDEILDAIRESTDRGVVYVHCWGGIGRTSTVVGCLLVDAGLDADAALEQSPSAARPPARPTEPHRRPNSSVKRSEQFAVEHATPRTAAG